MNLSLEGLPDRSGPRRDFARKKRGLLFRLGRALLVLLVLLVTLIYLVFVLPFWGVPFNQSRHGRVPLTPPWALECWLWEDDVHTAGKFHYMFGDDFLVAPIHQDKLSRTVSLPPGRWRYLFDDREVLPGPQELTRDFPLEEFPVFVRDGAVVPLRVKRSYTGFGDQDSADFTTWLIYPSGKNEFTLWHPETHPKPEATTVKVDSGPLLTIEVSGKHAPHILRILANDKPIRITLDGFNLLEGQAWRFDVEARRIIIKTGDYAHGTYLISRR